MYKLIDHPVVANQRRFLPLTIHRPPFLFAGSVVQGIELKVSLARRQPVIEPINDASSSATWSAIAASHSQKGSHKDKRDLVAYDQDDMF